MIVYESTLILTTMLSLILPLIFQKLHLVKNIDEEISIPYSGGSVIFLGISVSYCLLYFQREVSLFKFLFYIISLFVIYFIGIFDDLYGHHTAPKEKKRLRSLLKRLLSTGFINYTAILIISSYIFFFFNEEYWIFKGILTTSISILFSLIDNKPGRSIRAYFLFYILAAFSSLRWTRELYNIMVLVLAPYYCFDNWHYSALGKSGSNLIGFGVGFILSEMFSTNLLVISVMSLSVPLFYAVNKRHVLIEAIIKSPFLDYLHRVAAQRQEN
ncbi:hypothetical protein [Fonticella tunisiensis]|uniref:UDP-N-acetylmuramyl pentapeptide phosphotransferase/UDP-N-acetylglucosamine-1-phosphate transferase n=1 Tax=Fonticella tunisiensis TaxID=1096341 RepID=A0A4R7KSW3_9CLOT|nr:hypothetical protein [Fonticella tunisiensis]TDT61925.1 hypothetical protein EDD71_105104 [Fonticella tunisiensis]